MGLVGIQLFPKVFDVDHDVLKPVSGGYIYIIYLILCGGGMGWVLVWVPAVQQTSLADLVHSNFYANLNVVLILKIEIARKNLNFTNFNFNII